MDEMIVRWRERVCRECLLTPPVLGLPIARR